MARVDRVLTLTAAAGLGILGFLPIANWIPGGPAVPGYSELLVGWWSGALVVAGITAVVVLGWGGRAGWPGESLPSAAAGWWARRPRTAPLVVAGIALAVYLIISRVVLSGKPLLIDEIVQVLQARIYAGGWLTLPQDAHPEFFSNSLILNLGGRVFSQFPAGGPAMLALGSLVRAEWIVDPVFATASVLLVAAIFRRIEPRPGVAFAATVLFALAPFVAFMSGSHMNHVTSLTWLLIGMLGLVKVIERGAAPRFRDGLLLGIGFGVVGTIRPVDAFAFAVPAGFWLAARTMRSVRTGWPALAGAGIGILAPVAVMLWINAQTTGAALTFGYTALWGKSHDLGFHATPWGDAHTPARGLELINLYFLRLQSYLFESPVPSLVPAIGALALTRRLGGFDRYLLAAGVLLIGLYFAYWHDGFYLGPRFVLPLVPALALWSARVVPALRERFPALRLARGLGFGALLAAGIALVVSVPIRVREYRNGMLTMRWDADGAARRAGVRRALVLVRESWGAQLVARMWAAGIRPNDSEHLYRKTDACAMEHALDRIERDGLHSAAALAVLQPLLADSARLIPSPYTTDPTNRMLRGATYSADCINRLRDDQAGFTIFSPLLLAGARDDVVYARDLHARDTLLMAEYPGRALYLLRPATTAVGAEPRFYPLRRDSLLAAWRSGE